MAWAILLHYIWVEAVHAKVLIPWGAKEPWLNLTHKMDSEDKFVAGHMTALTQQKPQCLGEGCLKPVNTFSFLFLSLLSCELCSKGICPVLLFPKGTEVQHPSVVPVGLCWAMLVCSALWCKVFGFSSFQLYGSEQIVSSGGQFSSIKSSVLSPGILLSED